MVFFHFYLFIYLFIYLLKLQIMTRTHSLYVCPEIKFTGDMKSSTVDDVTFLLYPQNTFMPQGLDV